MKVEGNLNADKYSSILEDNIWPVIVRHFPENDYLFQDDNAPVHRARSTKEYVTNKDTSMKKIWADPHNLRTLMLLKIYGYILKENLRYTYTK